MLRATARGWRGRRWRARAVPAWKGLGLPRAGGAQASRVVKCVRLAGAPSHRAGSGVQTLGRLRGQSTSLRGTRRRALENGGPGRQESRACADVQVQAGLLEDLLEGPAVWSLLHVLRGEEGAVGGRPAAGRATSQ